MKSIFKTPVVTTATLPTVVPEGMEKLNECPALTEPMGTVPKFCLAELPVKLTCALAATGSTSPARRKSDRPRRAAIGKDNLVSANPVARRGRCIETRIAVSIRSELKLSI
jgi:hypothetical protein